MPPRHELRRSTTGLLNRIRRNVRKVLSLPRRNNIDNSNNADGGTTTTNSSKKKARDWRTLSPEFPPLPALDSLPPTTMTTTTNGDVNRSNNSLGAGHLTSLTDELSTATFAFSHYRQTPSGAVDGRHLYTIPEEGETMATQIRNSNEQYPPPSSVRVSDASSSSSPSSSSISSSASTVYYRPPTAWFTETPDAPHDDALIGDEVRCQLKLARIVSAASKQQRLEQNARTEILFDDHDNVRSIRIITRHAYDNNKISDEYWRFSGNSQYLPPELSGGVYNQGLADVWIMGVILYRMLVGKHPFTAPNDRKLFSKMLHGDFSIPHQLSDDAKDLLRRMLAPGNARASLDLVLFHPWLKPCSSIMLANNDPTSSSSVIAPQQLSSASAILATAEAEAANPSCSNTGVTATDTTFPAIQPAVDPAPNVTTTGSIKSRASTSHSKTQVHVKRKSRRRRISKSIMRIFYFLAKGPYPPPKQPYRELALLGRVHPTPPTSTTV
ncbi:hypothetical protein BDB00DRAFT_877878 [Zychaea mexicana]|uniref:uncharacterized protein n=1 Tax=Zychaea mexicana TaxID=64656 RepID=UPI0022FE1F0E|nr:uncharacterized protein BDB00DRAFT_877878 [Zychaea mexicana]KAI9488033.1 hypothetical protein BDB00DRAFT_877878 [Zychaea mexicana]